MTEPVVVVTGGARGLGAALARAYLAQGCRVAFCARSQGSVARALATFGEPDRVLGCVADVADLGAVERLWQATVTRFGRCDLWINNAGVSHAQVAFADLPEHAPRAVVDANLLGTLNGCRVALAGMTAQGNGAIYTMEGFGADGAVQHGMSVYGATKRAVRYFTRALARETRGGPVLVGSLSPGVVVTDLLVDVYARGTPANRRRARFLFKFIADPVEPVAEWLARRSLANRRHGAHLAWMTVPKAVLRFFQPRYHLRDPFLGRLPPG